MKLPASLTPRGLLVLGIIACLTLYANALVPLLEQLTQCYQLGQRFSTGRAYQWLCEAPLRAQMERAFLDQQKTSYLNSLYTRYVEPYLAQGAEVSGDIQCIRKEYRTLSDEERRRFHDAVNALKRDTTVAPSKYDAIALVHTGLATFMAHHGPGFLGWHRVYLLMFQAALKEVDPSVCVPYWNSALDSGLQNPAKSPAFSADFFGNGEGEVVTGPFAGWITPSGVPLRRAVGHDGQLITRQAIKNVMSRDTQEGIILPVIDPDFNLELHHGGVHVYIGGDMSILNTAANDPLFFVHHAFIDYLWELFRIKVRNKGLNPEAFPVGQVTPFHLPTFSMGFGNLTHADGYRDVMTSTYTYAPPPSCSASQPDCGSKYLSCDVANSQCLPVFPGNSPNSPADCTPAKPPSTSIGILFSALLGNPSVNPVSTLPGQCPATKPQADQNSLCVDGSCDMSKWVWIPVKMVFKRLPEWVDKPYLQVSVPPTMLALASDPVTGRCQLSSRCSIDGPCMTGVNTYQCSVFNEAQPCVESCSSYVICVFGVYRQRRCPAGKYFDRRCRCCVAGRCPGRSDDTIVLPGGYMQDRPDVNYGRSVGALVLGG